MVGVNNSFQISNGWMEFKANAVEIMKWSTRLISQAIQPKLSRRRPRARVPRPDVLGKLEAPGEGADYIVEWLERVGMGAPVERLIREISSGWNPGNPLTKFVHPLVEGYWKPDYGEEMQPLGLCSTSCGKFGDVPGEGRRERRGFQIWQLQNGDIGTGRWGTLLARPP